MGCRTFEDDVNRETLRQQLAQAEDHVTSREQMVARQRALVAELARAGCDTHTAMMLLAQLEESLEMRRSEITCLQTRTQVRH
jgi:hypothetical protein